MTSKEIKKLSDLKRDFLLHVKLLQRTGLSLSDARVRAWFDGPQGLEKLLPKEEDFKNG